MAVTPQTNADLDQIAGILRAHDSFVICGHVGPDGDCLGSQLALAHALRSMGKTATCVLVKDEPVPASLSFMPGIRDMVPAASYDGPCEVFVAVDVPTRERIGEDACALLDRCAVSVTVDHHAVDTTMTDYVHVDPDVASATMLVWQLAALLCEKPPVECALCAYTGLVTDTGGFRFQNTDRNAFATAAELVGAGADPAMVATHVYQSRTPASLKLESIAFDRMRLLANGAVALSWVTKADFEAVGAVKSDAETLVDAIRSVLGVRVACILREQGDYVRGNLRSKDQTDVAALARKLGGGGHRAAAGITLEMGIEEAVALMSDKLVALIG